MGRFINRDPVAEAGGFNLYCFVGNNPTTHWDYLGQSPEGAPDHRTAMDDPDLYVDPVYPPSAFDQEGDGSVSGDSAAAGVDLSGVNTSPTATAEKKVEKTQAQAQEKNQQASTGSTVESTPSDKDAATKLPTPNREGTVSQSGETRVATSNEVPAEGPLVQQTHKQSCSAASGANMRNALKPKDTKRTEAEMMETIDKSQSVWTKFKGGINWDDPGKKGGVRIDKRYSKALAKEGIDNQILPNVPASSLEKMVVESGQPAMVSFKLRNEKGEVLKDKGGKEAAGGHRVVLLSIGPKNGDYIVADPDPQYKGQPRIMKQREFEDNYKQSNPVIATVEAARILLNNK